MNLVVDSSVPRKSIKFTSFADTDCTRKKRNKITAKVDNILAGITKKKTK
jgi:hypothetical protein